MKTKGLVRKCYFGRYSQIVMAVARHGLGGTIRKLGLGQPLPFRLPSWMTLRNPWRKNLHSESVHVRMALEELSTTFVKIGQVLSTRVDLLPSEYTLELAKLQNSLKPLLVGVASIGQAHGATLLDGKEVVIKTKKPGDGSGGPGACNSP